MEEDSGDEIERYASLSDNENDDFVNYIGEREEWIDLLSFMLNLFSVFRVIATLNYELLAVLNPWAFDESLLVLRTWTFELILCHSSLCNVLY